MLAQITSSYFCAGVIFDGAFVAETAPILSYTKGWSVNGLMHYCHRKKWWFTFVEGENVWRKLYAD